LGVSRQYYTFKERDIVSKIEAGKYALQNVSQRWHKIIKESISFREGNKKSHYSSIFERRNDVLGYIDHIIQESNRFFSNKQLYEKENRPAYADPVLLKVFLTILPFP